MYNLNVSITFFHRFIFLQSYYKTGRKKERKKKKRFIVHILNSDIFSKKNCHFIFKKNVVRVNRYSQTSMAQTPMGP